MAFKQRSKQDVKSKKKIFGNSTKSNGKKRQSGVTVTFNDGEKVTLLNPSGKGEKYAKELKENKRYTNDGKVKTDKNGKPLELTKEQRAYRSAYITALSDSAKAYNAKKVNKVKNGGDKK